MRAVELGVLQRGDVEKGKLVTLDFIPFAAHRAIVDELVDEAVRDERISGALLIGSLGRGTALPGSDIDLFLLIPDGLGKERLYRNHERRGVLIEYHHRDVATARSQLETDATWVYAYLDSRVLYDPAHHVAELVCIARERYAGYRSTDEQKRRYAFIVDRTREKLQAAVDADDALRAGGVASTYATAILNGLWTAFDKPTLGVSEMWARLPDLVGLPPGTRETLDELFLGAALERARAGIILCEAIVARLGGRVLEPPW